MRETAQQTGVARLRLVRHPPSRETSFSATATSRSEIYGQFFTMGVLYTHQKSFSFVTTGLLTDDCDTTVTVNTATRHHVRHPGTKFDCDTTTRTVSTPKRRQAHPSIHSVRLIQRWYKGREVYTSAVQRDPSFRSSAAKCGPTFRTLPRRRRANAPASWCSVTGCYHTTGTGTGPGTGVFPQSTRSNLQTTTCLGTMASRVTFHVGPPRRIGAHDCTSPSIRFK